MKIAKLEMKLVLALGCNYELVNESGKYPDVLPEPDRNDKTMVNHFLTCVLIYLTSFEFWGNLVI